MAQADKPHDGGQVEHSRAEDGAGANAGGGRPTRVLLDASLDAATLGRARKVIESESSLVSVRSLVGRSAGRFRFIEAAVEVRVHELERADQIARELENRLRQAIPFLDRVVLDVKPARQEIVRLALPVQTKDGPSSEYFGMAPFFLVVERQRTDGAIRGRSTVANPFASDPRGRGIRVAHWLVAQNIDVLATPDDIREKGPGYALKEAGVEIAVVPSGPVEAALREVFGR
jgi:predicted Fe-Mo cluster-binding NifX family protein